MANKKNKNPQQKKSLIKSTLTLSLMTLLSRVMGLVREMTKARFLGTSASADAFGIAFMIPNLFRRLFAENSISVAFIPTFTGYLKAGDSKENHEATQDFVSATLTLVSFLTAVVTVLGMVASPIVVRLFYKGGTDLAIIRETTLLTRLMFPYLFVISVAAFLQGMLNGCRIFAPSGFTPVVFNAIVIAITYTLTPQLAARSSLPQEVLAARAMSFGVLTGGCFQVLFQWPFVRRTGFKTVLTTLTNAFLNKGTRRVVMLVAPTIVGMAAYQVNDLVSTAIAGRLGTGTVSSLQYSLRLQELILGIFAVSIGTVILPDLSGLAKERNWGDFNSMLKSAIKVIALITIPTTFFAFFCAKDIIALIYRSHSFTQKSVLQTLSVFRFHILGLFFIAANRVITPAFYAQEDTKRPTLAGILCFAVNMVLAFVFSIFWKGAGVALALSVASFANTLFLFLFMKNSPAIKNSERGALAKMVASLTIYIVRIICFSAIASCPTFFLHNYLVGKFGGSGARLVAFGVPLFLSLLLFAAIGVALLVLFKDESLGVIRGRLRKRG